LIRAILGALVRIAENPQFVNHRPVLIKEAYMGKIMARPWHRHGESPTQVYNTLAQHMTKGEAKRIK
jgi:hypothetical protein